MNRSLITSLLLSALLTVTAQPLSVSKHISVDNGLSNNFVLDICTDSYGSVWVATESGLTRIAGKTVEPLGKRELTDTEKGTRAGREIFTLYNNDTRHQMMIGTSEGLTLYDYDTRRATNLTRDDGLAGQGISHIADAGRGAVWLIFINGAVQKMDCRSGRLEEVRLEQQLENRCALSDGNGKLYLGHRKDGMSIVDLQSGKSRHFHHESNNKRSLPGNNVRCIMKDSQGNIWVGTDHGIARFDHKTATFEKVEGPMTGYDDNVHDIMEIEKGTLWVACDMGGISAVDISGRRTGTPVSTSSLNVRRIMKDAFGNIWIGNHSTGIDFISARPPMFSTLPYYTADHSLKRAYAITNDAKGGLWVGDEDEIALFRDNRLAGTWPVGGKRSRYNSFVMSMMADSRDNVWIGIEDEGAVCFSTTRQTFKRIDIGHSAPDIRSFCETSDGTVWIGSEFGVYTYKDGKVSEQVKINEATKGNVVGCIRQTDDGRMLVGTLSRGLFVTDSHGDNIKKIDTDNGLPSRRIEHIHIARNGGVWIGTDEGLAYLRDIDHPEKTRLFNHEQGLSDEYIRAIEEDDAGRIWVSTYSGISCLTPGDNRFHNYTHLGSAVSGSYISGSVAKMDDGTLYFGSPTGICYFNPRQMNSDIKVSEARIVTFEAYNPTGDDTEILNLTPDEQGHVETNHRQNTLRIAFTVKDYAQVADVEYAYMMKGMNDKWYYIGDDYDVVFRGLQPGHYTFILRAKLKNQDWQEASTTQTDITIAPPFWRTWWAYLFYILAAAAIGWYLLRNYKHKLKLQNSLELERRESLQKQELYEERLRFFTNITHELRTPLTLILGPLEDLVSDKRLPEAYHKKVELINKSAGRLRDLINQILEFRKTETQNRRLTVAQGDLGALVKEIGNYFKQLNRNQKVTIHIVVRPGIPPVYFDSEVITTVLNNLLSNAVKYTDEGNIDLIMDTDGKGQVYIAVKDTGCGIDSESLPHIFDRYYQAKGKHQASGTGIGLALVKSLADLHEATLTVESQLGKGSKITFALLTDNTYPNALHKEDRESEESRMKSEEFAAATPSDTADERPLLLVVEDNGDIRQYIADSMGDDYQVLQAADGLEGINLAMERMPDIIVSDVMMPKMNGIELTRRVKEDIRTSHIPIILLTAKDSIDDKEQGYDSGADSYLTKPFSARLLHSRINNLIASRRRLTERIAQTAINADGHTTPPTDDSTPEDNLPKLSRLDQEFIDKMNRVIEENIMKEELDMAFMTDKMAMSHSTFYRKVKALTGMSAKEYIRKRRLQRCAELLRSGDYNVTEAATMTGFNDLGNFREAFKKEFGTAPSEFIKAAAKHL